jgi:hypothetical protein
MEFINFSASLDVGGLSKAVGIRSTRRRSNGYLAWSLSLLWRYPHSGNFNLYTGIRLTIWDKQHFLGIFYRPRNHGVRKAAA